MMKSLRKFLLIFLCVSFVGAPYAMAEEEDDDGGGVLSWMGSTLMGLGRLFSCIERPEFSSMDVTQVNLDMKEAGEWEPVGTVVRKDKLLKIEWGSRGVNSQTRKYKVMFRIDPRFKNLQTFIQRYDYDLNKYVASNSKVKEIIDYLNSSGADEILYGDGPWSDVVHTLIEYDFGFSFVDIILIISGNKDLISNSNNIKVNTGEVVNISIDEENGFFGSGTAYETEYSMESMGDSTHVALKFYTTVPMGDNKIVYMKAGDWCTSLNIPEDQCLYNKYRNIQYPLSSLVGDLREPKFLSKAESMPACPISSNGPSNSLCYYDKGAGIKIKQGSDLIKDTYTKFTTSNTTGKHFLHYKANTSGDLKFEKVVDGEDMFNGVNPLFLEITTHFSGDDDKEDTKNRAELLWYTINMSMPHTQNFIYMGRYIFDVEVGNGESALTDSQEGSLGIEYYIQPRDGDESTLPTSSTSGTLVTDRTDKRNAEASGYLWIRAIDPNGAGSDSLSGNLSVKITNYRGSTWFSDVVYHSLVKPLQDKYNEIAYLIYSKLVTNPAVKNIARLCLSIYVIIYGLMFLMGATQITVSDLVARVVKIAIVITVFTDASWSFFNGYLFELFTKGIDYLFSSVIGATSQVGNLFGFVDPVIDKFTSGTFWGLLAIQLLQISNGLVVFAILTIYSMLIYFRALLEIIINYCLAFLGIAVLISLAPFFIIFILFEQTRSLFENWLSSLFNYMIQPTILLIFFLLIDQLMTQQITNVVLRACWGILIPIKLGLDLNHIGIPISFSFQLPFLPGIPFFVSQVEGVDSTETLFSQKGTFMMIASSSLLFYAYCKIAAGLITYVDLVAQSLTNVLAARHDGRRSKGPSPVHSVMSDIKSAASPVTGAASGAKGFVKNRVIGEKYQHRPSNQAGNIDYGAINRGGGSQGDAGSSGTIPSGGGGGASAGSGNSSDKLGFSNISGSSGASGPSSPAGAAGTGAAGSGEVGGSASPRAGGFSSMSASNTSGAGGMPPLPPIAGASGRFGAKAATGAKSPGMQSGTHRSNIGSAGAQNQNSGVSPKTGPANTKPNSGGFGSANVGGAKAAGSGSVGTGGSSTGAGEVKSSRQKPLPKKPLPKTPPSNTQSTKPRTPATKPGAPATKTPPPKKPK